MRTFYFLLEVEDMALHELKKVEDQVHEEGVIAGRFFLTNFYGDIGLSDVCLYVRHTHEYHGELTAEIDLCDQTRAISHFNKSQACCEGECATVCL